MKRRMALWYCCYLPDDDWGCYVVADTRGRAKSIFHQRCVSDYTSLRSYTDVRAYRIKDVTILNETIFEEDCPELEALGCRYLNDETIELEGGLPLGTGEN